MNTRLCHTTQYHHLHTYSLFLYIPYIPIAMSDAEDRPNAVTRFTIEKALWNCCVSLSLTQIMPNLYLGGYVPCLTLLLYLPQTNQSPPRLSSGIYVHLRIVHTIQTVQIKYLTYHKTPQLSSRLQRRLPTLHQHKIPAHNHEFGTDGSDASGAFKHGHRDGTVQQR